MLDGVDRRVLPFEELRDPATGRTRVRLVDTASQYYQVARDYMIRLKPEDLRDDAKAMKLAEAGGMSLEAFREEFSLPAM